MVWEELKESLIAIGMEAKNYEDVMRQLGGMLTEQGYAKDSYVDALIKREGEFPTGLDIDGVGIAIPHTDVAHVNKAATAIATLKEPVDFIQMGTDDEPVKAELIFMLSVDDPKAHLEQLQQIIAIIQDKEVLKNILETKEEKRIIEIIKEKESTL